VASVATEATRISNTISTNSYKDTNRCQISRAAVVVHIVTTACDGLTSSVIRIADAT
jgi:hypothetical protein